MKNFAVDIYIGGYNGERILSRLKAGKIPLLGARKENKNLTVVRIYRKDVKKVFAILKGSCYNILEERPAGSYAVALKALNALPFIIFAALFCLAAALTDGLVLRISYFGGGAYYEEEAKKILAAAGIEEMRFLSGADVPMASSQILSLKDVSYCSIKLDGYILKVEIETTPSSEGAVFGAMYSDGAGVIKSVVVLSGTPLVKEGDGVLKGDELVSPYNVNADGTKTKCLVSAKITMERSVSAVGETEEEAKNRAEFLAEGEIISVSVGEEGDKYKATAIYFVTLSMNF